MTERRDSDNDKPQRRRVVLRPVRFEIDSNPYPVWKRMREEAPLYYNEKYNFYALSRYEDVVRELPNWQTYRSGRGTTADILFANIEVPPGILLFEDPPLHDLHRKLLSRVFTPRRMLAVESLVRGFCVRELGPADRRERLRFHRRSRRDDADADHRISLGHPRRRIKRRSETAASPTSKCPRSSDPAEVDANVFASTHRSVRRVHRMAGQSSIR